jgi:hypothetical protein
MKSVFVFVYVRPPSVVTERGMKPSVLLFFPP